MKPGNSIRYSRFLVTLKSCSDVEKELLYYLSKLSELDKKEITEFTKIKTNRDRL